MTHTVLSDIIVRLCLRELAHPTALSRLKGHRELISKDNKNGAENDGNAVAPNEVEGFHG